MTNPSDHSERLLARVAKMTALHSSLDALRGLGGLDSKWDGLLLSEPKKLLNDDGSVNGAALSRFRRLSIFVSDLAPDGDLSSLTLRAFIDAFKASPVNALIELARELVSGKRRGGRRMLREIHDTLIREGGGALLSRYPVRDTPGAPFCFEYKGHSFNMRWARHIYFNNLINQHLGSAIDATPRFVNADVGCSYGTFSYIFKSEHPNTTHVLIDFPEQLILALYYLGSLFPEARIATIEDYGDREVLDRDYLEQFDFVLVPVQLTDRLTAGSVDMVTNFFSFGEMRRPWFEQYINSDWFTAATYLFTTNRFESAPRNDPTYDTDLTILDYPLDRYEKLFFGIFPIYQYYITRRLFFFYEKNFFSSQYFDFIGKRK